MLGDTVNLSARLMSHVMKKEGGGVICDERTFKQCRGGLMFEAGKPIHVKGKTVNIPIYRPYAHARDISSNRLQAMQQIYEQQLLRGSSFTRSQILSRGLPIASQRLPSVGKSGAAAPSAQQLTTHRSELGSILRDAAAAGGQAFNLLRGKSAVQLREEERAGNKKARPPLPPSAPSNSPLAISVAGEPRRLSVGSRVQGGASLVFDSLLETAEDSGAGHSGLQMPTAIDDFRLLMSKTELRWAQVRPPAPTTPLRLLCLTAPDRA